MDDCVAAPPSIVQRFTEVWAKPTADALVTLVTDDVRLIQPARAPIVGREAARRDFARLLRWQPALHGIVDDWAAREHVYIVLRLCFVLGGREHQVRTVDRITLRDDLIAERVATFDSLAFALAILRRPSEWLGFLRYSRG